MPQTGDFPSPFPGSHDLLLYGGDEQFLAAAAPFVADGVAAAEPVFVATGRHNTALLRRRLGARTASRVEFAPSGWYRTPAQALWDYRGKADNSNGASRVVGETPWAGRTVGQAREWTRFEALLTLAIATTGARHLCPYDTRILPSGILHAALLTHPGLTTGQAHRPNPVHMVPARFSAACDSTPLAARPEHCAQMPFTSPGDVVKVRRFAARQARSAGLTGTTVENLLLCVGEAAANAVRHGAGSGTCRIWTTSGEVVCEITDPSGTLDTSLAGYLPPAGAGLDGRGLWIIRQLADNADMRTGPEGTTVRIRMRRPGARSR